MTTITAHSSQRSAGTWRNWQYEVLHQIFRDACSDPFTWETVPNEGDGTLTRYCRRNIETGDVITCQGNADGSHTFIFTGA